MKEQLLKALRCKIEYPNEYESLKYEEIWDGFRQTDDYSKFKRSNFNILYDYFYSFISDLAPKFSKSERAEEVVSNLIRIMIGGKVALPNLYIKLLNSYKTEWVPSNREKFELLLASLEQQLNNLLSTNKQLEGNEQLENIEVEDLVHELDIIEGQKDEFLIENQIEEVTLQINEDLTEQVPPQNNEESTDVPTEKLTSKNDEKHQEERVLQNSEEKAKNLQSQDIEEQNEEIVIKWNHLDIEDGPDKHEENDHKWIKKTDDPFTLLGARVRGKKHKHEGSNCDDWLAMESAGQWNIIAVSDGAGSKKYSRVGAKASCEGAVEFLKEQLENCNLEITNEGNDFLRDPDSYKFVNKDLAYIEESLHTAFFKAYNAVEQAVKERMEGDEAAAYREILNRELEVNDLSCTLLLAVQTMVNGKSFVLACQIGDGATVAITENPNHPVYVLGVSDGGQYSGETDFLTSKKFEKENYLLSRTYPCYGAIRALMVMTGVADDYFPANEFMNLLYEDLCREKIIVSVDEEDYEAQAERLKYWLDSYQVRGSFDDRTLVVLYKGDRNE